MKNVEVFVVDTGTANIASVMNALSKIGANPRLTDKAGNLESAESIVLPGVGTFGAAVKKLRNKGLIETLAARITARRHTLAICLGLQLLCEESEETPGETGLGVIPSKVSRFPGSISVPQLGWNKVSPDKTCKLLQTGYAYFANSYRLLNPPPGWSVATSDHGGSFIAALESGPVMACQFHPELSGKWGRELLARWLSNNGDKMSSC